MFDFYFGTREEIERDPALYLITIKRMLPRWCNSIPDSEYLALHDLLASSDLPERPVFMETGSGASSIVLAYWALKTGGELFTWDIDGAKLAFLRSVLNDTLMRHFTNKNLFSHWRYTAFSSTSDHAGILILSELGKEVSLCFFDSEHTLDTLMREVKGACDVIGDGGIVAIDDGNYAYIHENTAYINVVRKKQGLPPVPEDAAMLCRPFCVVVGEYLKERFPKVEYIDDSYKKNYRSDIFWSYFRSDRETMAGLAMEKTDQLDHRFDAWRVFR
ncbi:MAG: hypothetical protein LUQ32_01880 [Methanomicrobiales archaeon]|nr:hypothetical protein [Methanomicrobiales archaeon]